MVIQDITSQIKREIRVHHTRGPSRDARWEVEAEISVKVRCENRRIIKLQEKVERTGKRIPTMYSLKRTGTPVDGCMQR